MRGAARARAAGALAVAVLACIGGALGASEKVGCGVEIMPGPDKEGPCSMTVWRIEGEEYNFHACPNNRGVKNLATRRKRRGKRGEKRDGKLANLPDGDDRVIMGWTADESRYEDSEALWNAVTYDKQGRVTGGILRNQEGTLFSVDGRNGKQECTTNPDEMKLDGKDIAVEPGKDHDQDHGISDTSHPSHDGEVSDVSFEEAFRSGRNLSVKYDACPRWSTLAVEVITELDRDFVNTHGGYWPARMAAADIMNLVAANYQAQIGVELKPRYYAWRGLGWSYSSSDAYSLLTEFRNRWQSGYLQYWRRGIVHLLTGKDMTGSIIGIAYVGVTCDSLPGDKYNGVYEYGVSEAVRPTLACNVGLVMHEIGHNSGSNHVSSGQVMHPSLTCSNTFTSSAISQIEAHLDPHAVWDGYTDGCYCERFWTWWPWGGWPWAPWWSGNPWSFWGPKFPGSNPFQAMEKSDMPDDFRELPKEIPAPVDKIPKGEEHIDDDGPIGNSMCSQWTKKKHCLRKSKGACDWVGSKRGGECVDTETDSKIPNDEGPINGDEMPTDDDEVNLMCSQWTKKKHCLRKSKGACDWVGSKRGGKCVGTETDGMNDGETDSKSGDTCTDLAKRQCRKSSECRFKKKLNLCVPK